ncbi:beta-N-acetylhexosaminidase [Oryzibacter oryziterrae]|uniref:beta-N-acetylhexosaminidase n=1 Tax=Oryzibacter oryziterrae TaxID=2766474 RepID=UPI001F025150|nr:beta-N-acetylhexosaminidase [Oryzibacter oryziterrae]
MTLAFVTGIAGSDLLPEERAFVRDAAPWGLILFRRNVVSTEQLKRLTADFRDAVGWNAPVLVDQEGGRVQRLTAPNWPKYPSGLRIAAAARLAGDETLIADVAQVMAEDMRLAGITIDCAPCLDLYIPGATIAIGDRCYSGDPQVVAAAGRQMANGLLAGGILPVIKHLPGHGRAMVDSHHELPVVNESLDLLAASDFAPFVALADLPAAMTAHLIYKAVDPDRPATQSPIVIGEIIRGLIGFEGLLFSDDLSMNALKGTLGERARATIAAGCDMALHCNGLMDEMRQVAAEAPELSGKSLERANKALNSVPAPSHMDREAVLARLAAALAVHDGAASI